MTSTVCSATTDRPAPRQDRSDDQERAGDAGAPRAAHRCTSCSGHLPRPELTRSFAEVAASTPESEELAKALRSAGFKFIGPTTLYAAMQACGVVNDHLATCWVRDDVGL